MAVSTPRRRTSSRPTTPTPICRRAAAPDAGMAANLKIVAQAEQTRRPVIELRGVSKTYRTRDGEVPSLRPIDFTVGDGEFVVVVGPSGCGKTTLLKMI